MKKLIAGFLAAGCIVTMGIPLLPTTVSATEITGAKAADMEISPYTSTFEVTGTGVRLREKPGTSSKIVRTLIKGEWVSGGREFVDKDGYTWTYVQCQSDRASGWVAIDYLTEIG